MQPEQRRFSIRYSIVAMIVLLLIEAYLFAPHPETLAYSDFIKLVKAGKVSDVTLSNQTIGGTLAANGLEAVSCRSARARPGSTSSKPPACPSTTWPASTRRGRSSWRSSIS
jgi:hypothetical protein